VQEYLIDRCRRDILFFVNCFVWQYNPQVKKGEFGPFITWEFQDDAFAVMVECIEEGRDLVIEKSREMGASWMCLIVMLWYWLFHPWKKFLCISRNAEAVESEDPDSLFWKIDFMLKHMPSWLVPKTKRRGMFYGNEDNGSTITGQASTGKAGVGGRATAMFVDEFSQIREDYEVLHRTADTTACRIFNFTHTDVGNAAAELSRRVDLRKLRLHWSSHPGKNKGLYQYHQETGKVEVVDKQYAFPATFEFQMDGKLRSPWYDAECVRRGSARAIAMDLDIDPRGSMSQFFDSGQLRILENTYCIEPFWEGELHFDKDTGRPLELVEVKGGHLRLWLHPTTQGKIPPAPYGAGADISTGSGATPSVWEHFARRHNELARLLEAGTATPEQVAEYANAHIEPHIFAALATALGWLFKDQNNEPALFCWELQGPGAPFGKKVIELGYRNIYYRTDENKLTKSKADYDIPGWYPSPDNKRIILEAVRAGMSSRSALIRSAACLDECRSFKYNANGTVEHAGQASQNDPTGARVNHGDRLTAFALAWKMARQLFKGRGPEKETNEVKVGSLAWRRELADQDRKEHEAWA